MWGVALWLCIAFVALTACSWLCVNCVNSRIALAVVFSKASQLAVPVSGCFNNSQLYLFVFVLFLVVFCWRCCRFVLVIVAARAGACVCLFERVSLCFLFLSLFLTVCTVYVMVNDRHIKKKVSLSSHVNLLLRSQGWRVYFTGHHHENRYLVIGFFLCQRLALLLCSPLGFLGWPFSGGFFCVFDRFSIQP